MDRGCDCRHSERRGGRGNGKGALTHTARERLRLPSPASSIAGCLWGFATPEILLGAASTHMGKASSSSQYSWYSSKPFSNSSKSITPERTEHQGMPVYVLSLCVLSLLIRSNVLLRFLYAVAPSLCFHNFLILLSVSVCVLPIYRCTYRAEGLRDENGG